MSILEIREEIQKLILKKENEYKFLCRDPHNLEAKRNENFYFVTSLREVLNIIDEHIEQDFLV